MNNESIDISNDLIEAVLAKFIHIYCTKRIQSKHDKNYSIFYIQYIYVYIYMYCLNKSVHIIYSIWVSLDRDSDYQNKKNTLVM